MKVSLAGKCAVFILCVALFPTCGELETLFPISESYQVRTLVNGSSLEDCSIIRSQDTIRPYFAISVVNDPDLVGLLVYLQNTQGEIVGDRVLYTIQPSQKASETSVIEPQETDYTDEITEDAEDEANTWPTVRERWVFTTANPAENTFDVEIAVTSLAEELPYFPMPKTLEIGSYVLVFEAVGNKEILSRTETTIFYVGSAEFNLKDIALYLPGQSGSQLVAPGTIVMLEARLDFDSRLDPYVIWYNGKNIIGRGKISEGAGTILWQAPEQAGFYTLRLEALPFQLKREFAGVFREIALPVSPKAASLGYFFENDKKHTGRSSLAQGIAYPGQVQLIMAMAVEDDDTEETAQAITLSAPEMPTPPELIHWYRFEGNLRDSLASSGGEQSLTSTGENPPHWAAAVSGYGLSIEADDTYLLSPLSFFRAEQDQGGGIFLLHLKPPTEGTILNVFFPLQSSAASGVWMDIEREKSDIVLRLRAGNTTVALSAPLAPSSASDFIPIVVEFYIRPYRLEAHLSLGEEYARRGVTGEIPLPGALTGEAFIELGAAATAAATDARQEKSAENNVTAAPLTDDALDTEALQAEETMLEMIAAINNAEESTDTPVIIETAADTENNVPANAIWNEWAILVSTVPLLQEEVPAELADEHDLVQPEPEETKPAPQEFHEIPIVADQGEAHSPIPEPAAEEFTPPDVAIIDGEEIEETEEEDYSLSPAVYTGDSLYEPEYLPYHQIYRELNR